MRVITVLMFMIGLPSIVSANEERRTAFDPDGALWMHRCSACHLDDSGGIPGGPWRLNVFGQEIHRRATSGMPLWDATFAAEDTDGDGYSNGLELGDPDGDRMVTPGWPQRSPGLTAGEHGRDLDECALSIATCPSGEVCRDQTHGPRPSYTCECETGSPGRDAGGVCEPACEEGFEVVRDRCVRECTPGFERRDGICERAYVRPPRVPLPDGAWVPMTADASFATVTPTGCATEGVVGGRSVEFTYPNDCPGGEVWAEVDTGALLSVRAHGGTERDCGRGGAIRWPLGTTLRVTGDLRGRVRALCRTAEPVGTTLRSSAAPTCSTGAPLGLGTHRISIDAGATPSPFPNDTCPADLEADLWVEHIATCDGRLRVSMADPLWCYPHHERIALYADECPDRENPIACEFWETTERSETCAWPPRGASAEAVVRRGERIHIRLSGSGETSAGLVGQVTIQCRPDESACDEQLCAVDATCQPGGESPCVCSEGFSGDGVAIRRGGTGCTAPAPACPLDCHDDGHCEWRWETLEEREARLADDPDGDPGLLLLPYCVCDTGYFGSGFDCAPFDECARGLDDCPLHSRCIDELPGFRCACTPGYWEDPTSEELACVVVCGDGEIGPGEECDDGNLRDGDGCDNHCEVERTFRCLQSHPPASYCVSTCDDGFQDPDDRFCPGVPGFLQCECRVGSSGEVPWLPVGMFFVLIYWRGARRFRSRS